ncbi:MAG: phosphatidate cytidylyltransferase [Clostridia bacterium]|nr:phosphatidate cytidylyltransferase [Clostridia bacterium]
MKTRIISGIVMGVIVAVVLALGFLVEPIIITVAVALIAVGAVYELIHNAAGIKDKAAWIGGCVFAFLFVILSDNSLLVNKYSSLFLSPALVKALILVYSFFAVIIILKNNKEFDLGKIVSLFAIPLPYAYAFSCLSGVIKHTDGIYYLLLLLNFSSICDMGAYFVGVTLGKHKLCPNLSPKKTVEGAVGGILSSVVVTLVISLCFGKFLGIPMLLTIPFCILGMIGDLFASAIKRSVGLKDYSNLIPGHGGILDRVDSIIMIAPFLYLAINLGVI